MDANTAVVLYFLMLLSHAETVFEDDFKLAKISYIFFPVCTCLRNVLLCLKERTCPKNFSLIYNFFSCVKVALPEHFI